MNPTKTEGFNNVNNNRNQKTSENEKNQEYKEINSNNNTEKISSNCLLCLITSFFTNYKFSEKKLLDASLFRNILVALNESIEKFNSKGVFNL